MGKTAFVLVLSMVLFLSISRTVLGTEDPAEIISKQMSEGVEEAMGMSVEDAKEVAQSWRGWFADLMQEVGLFSGNHQSKAAAGPGAAPAPAPTLAGPRSRRLG